MPDVKLSQIAAQLTSVSGADKIYVVDVSDLTDGSGGTSKYVTLSGLITAATSNAAPAGSDQIAYYDGTAADIRKMTTTDLAQTVVNLQGTSATSLTEKTTPAAADIVVIGDSAASYAAKKLQLGNLRPVECLGFAVGDEDTPLTTGAAKLTFRMPYAFTLSEVRASVKTAPTGSTIIVDINEGGVSIFSTRVSINATEKTSVTAAAPAVLSDTSLADDAEMTVDIDQVGSGTAGSGLKIYLIGRRS